LINSFHEFHFMKMLTLITNEFRIFFKFLEFKNRTPSMLIIYKLLKIINNTLLKF
jgi:hypothetical protein